jgi:hypothetical protein
MSNLIMFDGRMGAGKTLGMSIKALLYQKQSGCTLFSNYGLAGSIPFTSFEDFKKVAMQPSSIVCLDESHLDISNRDFSLNSVKFFVNMVWFLRKMRCTLMMTSPLFENIDSKVREVTNVYIHVSQSNGYMNYDLYDVEQLRFIRSERLSLAKVSEIAEQIYDTYDMVTPLEYPQKREDYLSIMNEVKRLNKEYVFTVRNASKGLVS